MIFVLDTTELRDQKRLEGGAFRLFLLARGRTNHRVCVPQVVLDEYFRAVRELMQSVAENVERDAGLLRRYWGKLDVTIPNVDEQYDGWRKYIEDRLRAARVEILPHPEVPHADVVARDIARRRPFNAKGQGYRDTLIWESILQLARASRERIVFITSNATDFVDDDVIHADLRDDLRRHELGDIVEVAVGLRAALDRYLQREMPAPDVQLATALQRASTDGIDLRHFLLHQLKDVAPMIAMPQLFEVEHKRVQISTVTSVKAASVKEARRYPTGEVYVELQATIEATVIAPDLLKADASVGAGWKVLLEYLDAFLHSKCTVELAVGLTYGAAASPGDPRALLDADVRDILLVQPQPPRVPTKAPS